MVIRKVEYGPQPPAHDSAEPYPNIREVIKKPRKATIKPIAIFNGRTITRISVEPVVPIED